MVAPTLICFMRTTNGRPYIDLFYADDQWSPLLCQPRAGCPPLHHRALILYKNLPPDTMFRRFIVYYSSLSLFPTLLDR